MQSGRYRHQVTLFRRADTQGSSGQVEHRYSSFATCMARISPVSGREFFAAAQVQSEVSTRISIRWREGVDETCVVKHVTDYSASPEEFDIYDILAVLPDEKTGRRELVLMCAKRIGEGWRNNFIEETPF